MGLYLKRSNTVFYTNVQSKIVKQKASSFWAFRSEIDWQTYALQEMFALRATVGYYW